MKTADGLGYIFEERQYESMARDFPAPHLPNFSSTTWYRLTNGYLGTGYSLDVVNDNDIQSSGALNMAASGNYTGQHWQIVGSQTTGFTLSTSFLGRRMVLDVTSKSNRRFPTPYLAPPIPGSRGQIWTISYWADGTFRLSSKATGEGFHLDSYRNSKEPFLGDGDHTGQHWRITAIKTIPDPETATGSDSMETESESPNGHGLPYVVLQSRNTARDSWASVALAYEVLQKRNTTRDLWTSPSPTFLSGTWYRLTNRYLGSASSLDVVNDNGIKSSGTLKMGATGSYMGQHWQIAGSHTTGFTLSTRFLGTTMVLDVTTETRPDPTPRLLPLAAGSSGQVWAISYWDDGTYRLSSKALGEGLHLDTYSDNTVPYMRDGDHSGQHWRITAVEPITDHPQEATHSSTDDSMEAESSGQGVPGSLDTALQSLSITRGSPAPASPSFCSRTWHRLTNLYMGSGCSLDVVNDNGIQSSGTLKMAASGKYSGQYWQIVGSPSTGFSLCTRFLGRRMVLDVTNETGPDPAPRLAPLAAGSSSQIWTISFWGDGTYRLSSNATGEDLHLDTYSDTIAPFLGEGDHSGQHWLIREIHTIKDPEFL